MADHVTVDELAIKIAADATAAAKSIDLLTTALTNLSMSLAPAMSQLKMFSGAVAGISAGAAKKTAAVMAATGAKTAAVGAAADKTRVEIDKLQAAFRNTKADWAENPQMALKRMNKYAGQLGSTLATLNKNGAKGFDAGELMAYDAALENMLVDVRRVKNAQRDLTLPKVRAVPAMGAAAAVAPVLPRVVATRVPTPFTSSAGAASAAAAAKSGAGEVARLSMAFRGLSADVSAGVIPANVALTQMKAIVAKTNREMLKMRLSGKAMKFPALTSMTNEVKALETSLKPVPNQIKRIGSSGAKLNPLTGSFIKLRSTLFFTLFILAGLAIAFKNTLGQASQMTEVANQVGVAFGDMSDEAVKWAEAISGGVLDVAPILRSASVFNDMARSMGVTSDQALIMSKNLTQLAYDYASLKDVPFAESQQKFQSALAGQTKGVRAYGLDITQASLQEEIYREGLNYKIRDLNRASKAVIIHNALLRQSTRAQGDLARTITTPANMMRVLADTFRVAGRAIGYLFMPMLKAVLPWLIGFAQMVLGAAQALGRVFGIKVPSWKGLIGEMGSAKAGTAGLADNMGKTEKAAKGAAKAAKAMRDYTLGIDELNILSPQTDTGGGAGGGVGGGMGGGVADGIKPMDVYDFGDIAKQIEKKLAPIKAFFKTMGEAIKEFTEPWIERLKALWKILQPIFKSIWEVVRILWDDYLKPILKNLVKVWGQTWDFLAGVLKLIWVIIEPIVKAMIKQFKWFGEKVFKPLTEWAGEKIDAVNWTEFFDKIIEAVKKAQKWVADKFKLIKDAFLDSGETWKNLSFDAKTAVANFVKKGWDATKEAWDTAKKWVSSTVSKTIQGIKNGWDSVVTAWDNAKSWVSNTVIKTISAVVTAAFEKASNAWDAFKDKSVSIGVSIRGGALAALNALVHGYNRVIAAAANATKRTLMVFRDTNGNYGIPHSTDYVRFMAQGGVAASGQMFVAGEAGPELMGSFGGNKNTVMPLANSGFVEAMAGAVYAATARAMRDSSTSGGSGDVYIDGEKAGAIIRKGERRSGISSSLVGTVG